MTAKPNDAEPMTTNDVEGSVVNFFLPQSDAEFLRREPQRRTIGIRRNGEGGKGRMGDRGTARLQDRKTARQFSTSSIIYNT
jgi:hypothetical protein